MKILILGHKGFLGSALWDYLEKQNHELHSTKFENLENLVKNYFDVIINAAGRSDYQFCEENRNLARSSNHDLVVKFLDNVINFAPATKFLNLGSIKEFNASSYYAVTKRLARMEIDYAVEIHGIWAAQLFLCNIVGPGQSIKFLIPKIIAAAREIKNGSNEKVKFGDLNAELKIMSVDAAAELIWKAAQSRDPNPYFLSGIKTTVRELIQKIFEKHGIFDWENHIEGHDRMFERPTEEIISNTSYIEAVGLALRKYETIDGIINKLL